MGVRPRMQHIIKLCLQFGLSFEKDVYIDEKMEKNPLRSSNRALQLSHEEGITHTLVVQDDVELCEDIYDFANKMVNMFPDDVFSLFCGSKK